MIRDLVSTVTKTVREVMEDPSELRDRARDLPLFLFQTALSGVGQALLVGDQIRTALKQLTGDLGAEEREAEERPSTRREPMIFAPRPASDGAERRREEPAVFRPRAGAKTAAKAAEKPKRTRATATTAAKGRKPAAKAPAASKAPAAAKAAKAAKPRAAGRPAAKPARAAKPVKPAAAAKGTVVESKAIPGEPFEGYAKLSLNSLRARLRGTTAARMTALITYEKGHAARPDVLQMYEKRLAKLKSH
ncbi:hypothetical protein [Rhizohabitans arisaemae]|uniref:hypothetical protein n=1 Tax=Rhizohabitans arisaemae TaxID=2720610 RepID=UPI0024B04863|nr:hypothetical protein [Rhizohabitans arisaemae]